MKPDKKKNDKSVNFEKSLEKLEKIVAELEEGDLPLDTSLKKYEEGIMFAKDCHNKLDSAKKKVEELIKKDDGTFARKTFEENE